MACLKTFEELVLAINAGSITEEDIKTSICRLTETQASAVWDLYAASLASTDEQNSISKQQCYRSLESSESIQGDQTGPWVIVDGDLELVRVAGQGGVGFSNNASSTALEFSTDGVNYGSFSGTLGGGGGLAGQTFFVRNPDTGTAQQVSIITWSGGGSDVYTGVADIITPAQEYSCTVYNGALDCCDNLGNSIEYDDSWEIIECITKVEVVNHVVNPNDILNKKCYSRPLSLIDSDNVIDVGFAPITENIEVIPDDGGEITALDIRIINNGITTLPIDIEVDGVVWTAVSQATTGTPVGELPAGRYKLRFVPPSPYYVNSGQTITISCSAVDSLVGWTTASDSDNNQLQVSSNGGFAQLTFYLSGVEKFCEEFLADGSVKFYDALRNELDEIPSNAEQVSCEVDRYITSRTAFCTTDDPPLPRYLLDWSDGSRSVEEPLEGEANWCECNC